MRAKGTVPVYADVDQALHRKVMKEMKARDLKLVQVIRKALRMWLDHVDPDTAGPAGGDKMNRGGRNGQGKD